MKSATSNSGAGEDKHAPGKKSRVPGGGVAQSGKVERPAGDADPRSPNGSPGRPKPDKRAPGKHPHGRPIPEKLPGR